MQQTVSFQTPQKVLDAMTAFLTESLEATLEKPLEVSPAQAALDHFQTVAASVPAYQAFLKSHGIDPQAIQTPADFETLPLLTKANYMQAYPLPQRCRNGQLSQCDMVAVSSGSTGEPTLWPRFVTDELAIARRFEQIFVDSFDVRQKTTLAVVCFALGTWVGGMYSASCCRHLASKGYPITVVTPGNNKAEILRTLRSLGGWFDQVVLLGYPPFLKDVVDTGIAEGLDWQALNIRLVMAGEVFSEEWRSLMANRTGCSDILGYAASMYGTADAGVLGNETPLSVHIRRFLAQHPDTARKLFGESRLPTLVQYDPLSRYFEVTPEGTLLFTGDNGVPLVRYHILDQGGLYPFDELLAALKAEGFDALATLPEAFQNRIRRLPFVYVFGRSHFTVSYFGANLYPENVTVALEQAGIQEWVTGKFVMQVIDDADCNRQLHIAVELAPVVTPPDNLAATLAQAIQAQLIRLNSEFAHYVPPEYQLPQVSLHPMGDPNYFPIGVKHRYTRANQKI